LILSLSAFIAVIILMSFHFFATLPHCVPRRLLSQRAHSGLTGCLTLNSGENAQREVGNQAANNDQQRKRRQPHLAPKYTSTVKGFGIERRVLLFFQAVSSFLSSRREVQMRGRRSTLKIHMNEQTRIQLQKWVRRQKTPVGLAKRARAMLLLEQGQSYVQTAKQVGLAVYHLRKWASRFLHNGETGLLEKPRPGRRPLFPPEVALHVVKFACERPDHLGSSLSHWDCTELARKL
jgi:hypothetical protein